MCNYRENTSSLNTFGIVMGVLTAVITICNIALFIDMFTFHAQFGAYFIFFTIVYAVIGFCNYYYGRKKSKEGDEIGLHICVLVIFMVILPITIIWSWWLTFWAIVVNVYTGDQSGAYFALYMWYINLIFGISLMITSWFTCLQMIKPTIYQTTTVVQMPVGTVGTAGTTGYPATTVQYPAGTVQQQYAVQQYPVQQQYVVQQVQQYPVGAYVVAAPGTV